MFINKYQHITDKELLEKYYTSNNNQWLGILLKRYTLLLFGVCMKYLKNEELAKDIVQQINLKVLQMLPDYKVTFFKSWLYMVAKNECLMHLRKSGINYTEQPNIEIENKTENMFDADIKNEKAIELVPIGLQQLNKDQYLCVTLFYLKDKSYQTISEILQMPINNVKSHIQNGKRNLKIWIENKIKQSPN